MLVDRDGCARRARRSRSGVANRAMRRASVRAVRPDGVPTVWKDGASCAPGGDGAVERGRKALSRRARRSRRRQRRRRDQRSPDRRLSSCGVVPLEMGAGRRADSAAVQAQAVTARSYAYIHLTPNSRVRRDRPACSISSMAASRPKPPSRRRPSSRRDGLVLRMRGRVVNAPYHSTCGGTTAASSEIWRSERRAVSAPGERPHSRHASASTATSRRAFVDATLDVRTLNAAIAQYLARYTNVPDDGRRERARDHGRIAHACRGASARSRSRTDRGTSRCAGTTFALCCASPVARFSTARIFRSTRRRRPTARWRNS